MLGATTTTTRVVLALLVACAHWSAGVRAWAAGNTCTVQGPLGAGLDDTDQVRVDVPWTVVAAHGRVQIEAAIARCGHYGTTTINAGVYNITRWVPLAVAPPPPSLNARAPAGR